MSETIIESVLTGKLDPALLIRWLTNDSLEDVSDDCVLLCCDRNEFVTHFLSYLRRQTDSILQTNTSALQVLQHQNTPEKLLSARKHHRSISDPTYETDRSNDTLSVKPDRKSHESPSRDKKRTGRRVKTKLFESEKSRDSISSDESRICSGVDRIAISSTPMKHGLQLSEFPNLPLTSPVTPHSKSYERCDTPRLSYRHTRSQEKSCLGDYIATAQRSSKKKRTSRNVSDDSDIVNVSKELDISNSDVFPEIGARKSNSLKSEKRRIKPTNIDHSHKSQSLNSFNSECFQQPSPLALEDHNSSALKFQPNTTISFDAERKILKQDKHKLMEKFNSLNTTASTRTVAPQMRIMQKELLEKPQNLVKTEPSKVTFKDKLDVIIEVYKLLIQNNLILSMNMEIYYIISVLLSQQNEEDYFEIESKLTEETIYKYLLKSIHNTTYFSVKSLWCQREVLEVILDKNSLKLLGESKRVRSFYPELAKFLLNLYGLKCEAENQEPKSTPDLRVTNGVVCFNFETDNVDNFPSMASFQNFKKQRDMFYELLRWYSCGPSLSSLRPRARALLAAGGGRLAALMVAQMGQGHTQDSKLNKLARRLTRPAQDNKNSHFSDHEMFYRDVLVCADSDSFRTHVRDALISEICSLNTNSLASPDITKDYIHLVKKLCLLSKFLALTTSLPYIQANEGTKTHRDPYIAPDDKTMYHAPKEKVLDNNLVLRSFTQPNIDLKGILLEAKENGRLSIAIPWIVQYLVILDYTSLRTKYNKDLLNILFEIYTQKLLITENNNYFKKNTIIYLKSVLGWLCSQNQFPQEFFYEKNFSVASDEEVVQIDKNKIDFLDFVDENVISELCPYVKDIGLLLTTCRVPQEQKEISTFRHITPVSLSLNSEERIKNKEKELQNRLEEQIVRSMASSSRRVLELVIDRMYHMRVKEAAPIAAKHANRAVQRISQNITQDHKNLVTLAETILMSEVNTLRNTVISSWQSFVRNNQLSQALSALSMEKVHTSLVAKGVQRRLNTKYSSTAILCKDVEGLVKSIISARTSPSETEKNDNSLALTDERFDENVSAAQTIIDVLELVQSVLFCNSVSAQRVSSVLSASSQACSDSNVFSSSHCRLTLLQLSVDLAIAYVVRRPSEVTDSFLSLLSLTWRHFLPDPPPDVRPDPDREPDVRDFGEDVRAPTPDTSDEEKEPPKTKNAPPKLLIPTKLVPPPSVRTPSTPNTEKDDSECAIFSRLLCPRNISLLSTATAESWKALSILIQYLRKKGFCQEQELAESCLSVYTQEFDKTTLENLSNCIKSVSSSYPSNSGKVNLFLDFLSEYCRDMNVDFEE